MHSLLSDYATFEYRAIDGRHALSGGPTQKKCGVHGENRWQSPSLRATSSSALLPNFTTTRSRTQPPIIGPRYMSPRRSSIGGRPVCPPESCTCVRGSRSRGQRDREEMKNRPACSSTRQPITCIDRRPPWRRPKCPPSWHTLPGSQCWQSHRRSERSPLPRRATPRPTTAPAQVRVSGHNHPGQHPNSVVNTVLPSTASALLWCARHCRRTRRMFFRANTAAR
jgi:hypothetical protein